MILEIRTYRLQPSLRDEFLNFFTEVNAPALRAGGMRVSEPMTDLDEPDIVHWIRGFSSLADRDRIKDAFYDTDIWHNEIEPIVMPMIVEMTVKLVEGEMPQLFLASS
ncbi:NIPSNAP protein [Epibacterium ulvae]|uniref:NIPSNAP protein n=2 Tax=Epibacterium ulvae TaxID=1156985 RepID=A0A1G5QY51_9RHOB|nr:NIPSNAP protein [Epibacterium ulvae]